MTSLLATASLFEEDNTINGQKIKNSCSSSNRGRTMKKSCQPKPASNKSVETLMMMTAPANDEDESGLADFTPMKPELTRVPQGSRANRMDIVGVNADANADDESLDNGESEGQHGSNGNQMSLNEQQIAIVKRRLQSDSGMISEPASHQSHATDYHVAHNVPTSLSNLPQQGGMSSSGNQDIDARLNYIIHLLEDQQNSRTNTTTEELILYSFLGVFTIYIVDSFTRVGREYTR